MNILTPLLAWEKERKDALNVMADMAEEQGDERAAAAYRSAFVQRCVPLFLNDGDVAWTNLRGRGDERASSLPDNIFACIHQMYKRHRWGSGKMVKLPSVAIAYVALVDALIAAAP